MCLSAGLSENHSANNYKTQLLYQSGRGHHPNRFRMNFVGKPCLSNLVFLKISDVFFRSQTFYWIYLRNGWSDWCETKRMHIGWILGELCDLDLWPPHDFLHDLWFFKVKFQNSCISGIVIWLMWYKKRANQLDTGLTVWSYPLTTPMTLTLLFPGQSFFVLIFFVLFFCCCCCVFFCSFFFFGGGCWLIWNERNLSQSFMTMTVTYGWCMYSMVTGVTSDVGVPSTYLVMIIITITRVKNSLIWRVNAIFICLKAAYNVTTKMLWTRSLGGNGR